MFFDAEGTAHLYYQCMCSLSSPSWSLANIRKTIPRASLQASSASRVLSSCETLTSSVQAIKAGKFTLSHFSLVLAANTIQGTCHEQGSIHVDESANSYSTYQLQLIDFQWQCSGRREQHIWLLSQEPNQWRCCNLHDCHLRASYTTKSRTCLLVRQWIHLHNVRG